MSHAAFLLELDAFRSFIMVRSTIASLLTLPARCDCILKIMVCILAGNQNPNYRHGLTNGRGYRHPLYIAWQNMNARCNNPNYAKYHRYGGRGIVICQEWMNKDNFFNWAFTNGWQQGLTIDRKENDGNYEPSNCQWIILGKNSRKKSTTKLTIEKAKQIRKRVVQGENEYNLAIEFNVSHGTIWFILHKLTWDENL